MNSPTVYNPDKNIFIRIWDHASLGLASNIGNREKHPPNLIEKSGDAVLWTVGLVPRAIEAVSKSLQDPRVVTIALTAFALLSVSLLFYPTSTFAISKLAYLSAIKVIHQVPFWAVKFSVYIGICASIIGAGLRAGGRFNNANLMKEFYNLPSDYPHNPARLYAEEIAQKQLLAS